MPLRPASTTDASPLAGAAGHTHVFDVDNKWVVPCSRFWEMGRLWCWKGKDAYLPEPKQLVSASDILALETLCAV